MTGPLSGLKVLELAGFGPVTLAAMILADLGASVIRVERPNAVTPDDDILTRGRESITLDLKSGAGREIVLQLARQSDVILEGYRPGVIERLGLGYSDVSKVNEAVILARLTGWGQEGPWAHRAGRDLAYIALSGALYPIGPADSPPSPPMNYVGDMGGGAMLAVVGILAALRERESSGVGQEVDAAMVDGVALLSGAIYREIARGHWDNERGSNVADGSSPYYRVYRCRDGQYVAVAPLEDKFYHEFLRVIGLDPSEIPDRHDRRNWPQLVDLFSAALVTRTRSEWETAFRDTDACVAPVLSPLEAPHHEHLRSRHTFVNQGPHFAPAPAPRFSRTALSASDIRPVRGADARAVLMRLGYADDEIQTLVEQGVVHA